MRMIGASSSSVVTCVVNARFLTRPHASPSGVSDGQSIPHWLGWSERGPDTFRVFSNCEVIRVIIPSAEMNERRDSCCVTPARSILKRVTFQLPVAIAWTNPAEITVLHFRCFDTSNGAAFVDGFLLSSVVAIFFRSAHSFLNRSSKRRERS
jgi:hypothetical protein